MFSSVQRMERIDSFVTGFEAAACRTSYVCVGFDRPVGDELVVVMMTITMSLAEEVGFWRSHKTSCSRSKV